MCGAIPDGCLYKRQFEVSMKTAQRKLSEGKGAIRKGGDDTVRATESMLLAMKV
jgi:hypothetical protein